MNGIDRHIEQPDDDLEPREPVCDECGGDDEGGHESTCRHNTEPPQPFEDRWEPSEGEP